MDLYDNVPSPQPDHTHDTRQYQPPFKSAHAMKDTIVLQSDIYKDIPTDKMRRPSASSGPATNENPMGSRIKPSSTQSQKKSSHNEVTVVLPSRKNVPLSKFDQRGRVELLNASCKDGQAREREKNEQNLAEGYGMTHRFARWDVGYEREGDVYNRTNLQQVVQHLRATERKQIEQQTACKVISALVSGLSPLADPPARTKRPTEAADVQQLSYLPKKKLSWERRSGCELWESRNSNCASASVQRRTRV